MTQELSGRVAIVTGAGRNIGRGIALALADAGAAVVVNARSNLKEAEAVAGEIERGGGRALAVTADVADADAVGAMVAAAASRFGRIDILVNNAAVRVEQALETMTLADWRAVTGVILDGAFNCVKACLPHLKQSGAGVIVNIGGLSSHTGAARRPHVVTAKAGLVGFTRALAHELAPDKIRVNTVTPGLMATPRPAGAAASFARAGAGGPARRTRRHRRRRALPLRSRRELHHRAEHPGERRGVFGVTAPRVLSSHRGSGVSRTRTRRYHPPPSITSRAATGGLE
jgi:3-oxoacyl-[acyl-carrier protein] reductase